MTAIDYPAIFLNAYIEALTALTIDMRLAVAEIARAFVFGRVSLFANGDQLSLLDNEPPVAGRVGRALRTSRSHAAHCARRNRVR